MSAVEVQQADGLRQRNAAANGNGNGWTPTDEGRKKDQMLDSHVE